MGQPFKLHSGNFLVSTEAPGGIYNATQLKKIAEICDGGMAIAKATEDQRLALLVPEERLASVSADLQAVGLGIRHYRDGLHQPLSCIGGLCPMNEQDAQTAAMEVTEAIAKVTLESPLRIGINGCGQSCVPVHTLDVSIVGESNGYRISLGGKNSQLPELATFMAEGVPGADLPKVVAKLVEAFRSLATPGETLHEVIERCGSTAFIDALSPYSQDASGGGIDLTSPPATEEPASPPAAEISEIAEVDRIEVLEEPSASIPQAEPESTQSLEATTELAVAPASHQSEISPQDSQVSAADSQGGILEDDLQPLHVDDGAGPGPDIKPLDFDTGDAVGGATEISISEPMVSPEEKALVAGTPEVIENVAPTESDPAEVSSADLAGLEASPAPEAAASASHDEAAETKFEEAFNESIVEEDALAEVATTQDAAIEERLSTIDIVEESAQGGAEVAASAPEMASAVGGDVTPLREAADAPAESGWTLTGIQPGPEGRLLVQLASGAAISLDPAKLVQQGHGKRRLALGSQTLDIWGDAQGVHVEVDGVGFFLPRQAA